MIKITVLKEYDYIVIGNSKKREIVGEYQVVTAKKVFNDEKEPDRRVEIHYEV